MKKGAIVFSLALICCLAYSVSGAERGLAVIHTAHSDVPVGNFYLLAVGIDKYVEWPQLKTAVNDARGVEKLLRDQYRFDSVISLYDGDATRQKIMEKLRSLTSTLKVDDSLVIFYSGHGHFDEVTETGSWIPVEASMKDDSTWLDNTKIKSYIRSMQARHVLLISDSCFSGDFFQGPNG